jgi:GH15 family glucan-1,4-alpha-glucosidase
LAADQSRFPRIARYGFLSDCHTGALLSSDGSVEWLCLPRFDSPSVFGSLLDRGAGYWRLGPADVEAPSDRRYEPGTNVLETTWMGPSGWLVVRDALTIGEWRRDETDKHSRPPTDHDAEHVLVRVAACLQGEVDLELTCHPMFDYGAAPSDWQPVEGSETSAVISHDDLSMTLSGDIRFGVDGPRARGRHTLRAGESCFSAVSWGADQRAPESIEDARSRLDVTNEFWRRWLAGGDFPDHSWGTVLQRSALVLKALTYSPTGATVAALTTSLPETPGGERNWDYRFTWIRDATFTLWAMHTLGFDWEAIDFMEFIADICREEGPRLQIMYGLNGERDLTERTLDHLHGYEGAKPVRVGNGAFDQRQNDVYGALLDSMYIHIKTRDHLPDPAWSVVADQVEAAAEVWKEPDQGIWETRGDPKHYVSSKLMCWVALDRGARLAERRDETDVAEKWGKIADEIRADILERGVSDRHVFRQHYDTDALDASTLLVPLVRFLPPDDERVEATVRAIADELTQDGLVLRYRVEDTDDGLSGSEGTFTICSFWLASALSEIGEPEAARELCEKLIAFAGPLGLYAEEIDPRTGRHWGNFPQAFTHLALINAVSHVIADDIEGREPGERTAVFSEMRRESR